jgi:hypothetical protein
MFTKIFGHIKHMSEGHAGSLEEADDKYLFDMIPYKLQ